MASVPYFAYGSNILTERLQARCKFAKVRCVGSADGYRLAYGKKSRSETIGRPLGSAAFLEDNERQIGRSIRPAKPGPKPQKQRRATLGQRL